MNFVDPWGLEGWGFMQAHNYMHNQGLASLQPGYTPTPTKHSKGLPKAVKQGGITAVDTAAQAAAVHLAKKYISPAVGGALNAANWAMIIFDPLPPPAGGPGDMFIPLPEIMVPTPPPNLLPLESDSPCK